MIQQILKRDNKTPVDYDPIKIKIAISFNDIIINDLFIFYIYQFIKGKVFYDKKYKLKNVDIDKLVKDKEVGLLTEEEWKRLIYVDRDEAEGRFLENKIMEVIQKKYMIIQKKLIQL